VYTAKILGLAHRYEKIWIDDLFSQTKKGNFLKEKVNDLPWINTFFAMPSKKNLGRFLAVYELGSPAVTKVSRL
jgi:hypothetical protein